MTERLPKKGREVVTRSKVLPGTDGRVTVFTTEYDPAALDLPDQLAIEMMKHPSLLELVRVQRPDLFSDRE